MRAIGFSVAPAKVVSPTIVAGSHGRGAFAYGLARNDS
jgi:hypothetical protein